MPAPGSFVFAGHAAGVTVCLHSHSRKRLLLWRYRYAQLFSGVEMGVSPIRRMKATILMLHVDQLAKTGFYGL